MKRIILLIVFGLLFSCNKNYNFTNIQKSDNIIYGGLRSSSYGMRPFPKPEVWICGINEINSNFSTNSVPSALWIVGVMGRDSKTCRLEFQVDTSRYENITCLKYDKHEKYLSYFDTAGVKVFLQVESAMADVETLIELVFDQYGHHPCVIGFGVDAEWHRYSKENDWGVPIDDESAEKWEKLVKSYNPDYQLFLKHWDRKWMPRTYRGDLIFVDDSQQFKNKNHLLSEFTEYWGEYFYPNTVFYQIGYPTDKKLWNSLDNPIGDWGVSLANTHKQKIGIYWADFTLKETVTTFKNEGDFIIGAKIYKHEGELKPLFDEMKSIGINTLFASKELNAKLEFRQLAKQNNMKRFLIFPTFFDPEYLKQNPDHYAIQNNGKIAKDEWVEFVCPSRDDFRDLKIVEIQQMVKEYDLDGISIDFVRHFAFWEKIYPDRTTESLPNTCFCEHCMEKFQKECNIKINGNSPEEYYNWILENNKVEWVKWKSNLITSMIHDLVTAAKEVKPNILTNIHAVPWMTEDFDNAIENVIGQNLKEIGKFADYISPMVYAHMVKQNPDWISSVVREMDEKSNCKIIPSIQVSKAYLKEDISKETFRLYLRNSYQYPSAGIIFWSWERLSEKQKKMMKR